MEECGIKIDGSPSSRIPAGGHKLSIAWRKDLLGHSTSDKARDGGPSMESRWLEYSNPKACLAAARASLNLVAVHLAPMLNGDFTVPHSQTLLARSFLWEATNAHALLASEDQSTASAASKTADENLSSSRPDSHDGMPFARFLRKHSEPSGIVLDQSSLKDAKKWHSSALTFSHYDFDKPLIRQLRALGDRIARADEGASKG